MAFSRHNIEKRRLIELVRLNPILWDCRLPHYKRSDKKKAIKWNELGRMFNVNGERVQRTFTSLREIFRRELNHEKMLGSSRFKSKWEYYDAMAFLKEVIRERKSRERIKHGSLDTSHGTTTNTTTINNNNNNNDNNNSPGNQNHNHTNSVTHDEYQYFAPSDPNNPQNQPPSITESTSKQSLLPNLNIPPPAIPTILPVASLQAVASANRSPPQVLSSSPTCSSSPSIYIKDEPDSQEEEEIGAKSRAQKLETIRPGTKQQLKARLQLPQQYATPPPHLIINANNELIDAEAGDLEDDLEDDFDEDDESRVVDVDMLASPRSSCGAAHSSRPQPSPRELLYTKFGDFLAARLNTLNETVANELMNKILLLIAEK